MSGITRRDVLGSAALIGGWVALGSDVLAQQPAAPGSQPVPPAPPADGLEGPYKLPPLPYGYGDLEPFLNVQTLKLHHDIHHAAYVKNANAAVAELEAIRHTGGDTVKSVRAVTDKLSFNLSGHLLHALFWNSMTKSGGGDPPADSDAGKLIRRDFGTYEAFRANLSAAAAQVQGSGWAVLVYEPLAQRLMVLQAEKHENGGAWGAVPLLALDVWEHAYYLQYQNKRTDFIKAFTEVINWASVEERLHLALKLA
jgi:Fe-Mn family superoxide dismutase